MIGNLLVITSCLILLLVAMAGTVLPLLPGAPLGFLALLIYGFYTHFSEVTVKALVIFGLLVVLTFITDFFSPAFGASRSKASAAGIAGALAGGFFGAFVFGPYGVIFGPLFGGFIGEYASARDTAKALQTAWGSFVGYMVSTVLRFTAVFSMLGYFIYVLIR